MFTSSLRGLAAFSTLLFGIALAPAAASAAPAFNVFSPEHILGAQSLSRDAAPAVAAKVTASTAYAMPLAGRPLQRMAVPYQTFNAAMDLTYYGGPVLGKESAYNIYVNCGSQSCWGTPGNFLQAIASNSFIHLLDQYTGSTANSRYTYAGGLLIKYNTTIVLQDQDIYNIVYAAASSFGKGGYGHIYHVFLEKGVQQCSQAAGGCYGVQYCAYHGAVDFSGLGHAIYSVEPYQGINGCQSPNGKLTDSTDSTLSHEFYEAVTDPDVQTNLAWYNNNYGEIGDICRNSYGFVMGLNLQKEYSNKYHACAYKP